jgi:hypothetical protein
MGMFWARTSGLMTLQAGECLETLQWDKAWDPTFSFAQLYLSSPEAIKLCHPCQRHTVWWGTLLGYKSERILGRQAQL